MAARKDKDAVAFTSFADAETSSALNLKVGVVRGAIWRPIAGVYGTRTPVVGYEYEKSE